MDQGRRSPPVPIDEGLSGDRQFWDLDRLYRNLDHRSPQSSSVLSRNGDSRQSKGHNLPLMTLKKIPRKSRRNPPAFGIFLVKSRH